MRLSQVRTAIKRFLAAIAFRVDNWGLDPPDRIQSPNRPPSIGSDKDLSDCRIIEQISYGEEADLVLSTNFDLQIQFLFANPKLTREDLPLAAAEDCLVKAIAALQTGKDCIAPDIRQVDASGSCRGMQEKQGGWMIVFELNVGVQFVNSVGDRAGVGDPEEKKFLPIGGNDGDRG